MSFEPVRAAGAAVALRAVETIDTVATVDSTVPLMVRDANSAAAVVAERRCRRCG